MKFTATYDIEPVAQGRPRFNSVTKRAKDPHRSKNFKRAIAILTRFKFREEPFKKPIKITTRFYRPIPIRTSEKKRELMEKGEILPQTKPDVDNYFKGFTDALNGLIFEDDKQIAEIHAYKFYSDNPRIELEVEEIE